MQLPAIVRSRDAARSLARETEHDPCLHERDSTDAYARYWAGRVLVVLRREPRRAQSYLWPVARGLRRPLDFGPPFAVVVAGAPWWRLGHTYVQLGMLDSARLCFEEALKASSDTAMVRAARAALDSLPQSSSGREGGAAAPNAARPDRHPLSRGTRRSATP